MKAVPRGKYVSFSGYIKNKVFNDLSFYFKKLQN